MINRVAIFLALALLAQAFTPLTRQLAKLPALMAHFYAHHDHARHDHGDKLAFSDFLAQHYAGRAHHDDASRDHSNLPFRSADVSCAVLLLDLPSELPLPDVKTAPVFQPKSIFGSTVLYSSLFEQDIFRPPLA